MALDTTALATRWFEEVWNHRRAETIDELLTAESVCHTDDGPVCGPDGFKQRLYHPLLAAFPDLRIQVEGVLAQDDQVVVRWSAVGVHSGEGLGFPPTQDSASFRGITWVRICDGKFQEAWQTSNIPEVLRTLSAKALA
ncbi:ester cyclase [Alienimonas chondri]|uniref:Ester cyclase n=1 Tax=Alienimonas chondri TaxID=2681879 RepID=A0ABX1VDX6_9PLAN|nr:ester cyclase [Alienimonas chondri]NNJ25939.1 hypothetical protein [Alienimonas chondri]